MSVKSDHTFRDRTHEFFSIAERLKKSIPPQIASSSSVTKLDGSRSAISSQSEFNSRASRIGLGIHQTSQKLLKLAMRKSTMKDLLYSIFFPFFLFVLWNLI